MMQGSRIERRSGTPAAIGIVLVVAGIAVIALRRVGVDVVDEIERAGWPFFVIIPGLVLIAMAFLPAPPQGLGFAIAGSIVTTVGLLLFYQQSTGHWESWAYAWALIPAASGLAMATYGLASRHGELVRNGLWLGGIAAVLFAIGFWFFETIFQSGRVPVDLGTWWPAILIGIGLVFTLSAVVGSSRSGRDPSNHDVPTLGGDQP
jgi:hypothetical protein